MACLKCGAAAQVEDVRMIDRADLNIPLELTAQVDRDPGALLFKGAVTDSIHARVCGECGFVELYARNPKALVRAAESRRKSAARKRAGK
jgi:hypothetical protein